MVLKMKIVMVSKFPPHVGGISSYVYELSKKLVERGNDKHIEIEYSEWYETRRKGRIFGFWHKVGHEAYFDGDIIPHTTKTVEEMEEYVRKWHEVNYSNSKIEIVKKFKL